MSAMFIPTPEKGATQASVSYLGAKDLKELFSLNIMPDGRGRGQRRSTLPALRASPRSLAVEFFFFFFLSWLFYYFILFCFALLRFGHHAKACCSGSWLLWGGTTSSFVPSAAKGGSSTSSGSNPSCASPTDS